MLCCYAKTLQAIQIGRQELAQNRQQARNSVEAGRDAFQRASWWIIFFFESFYVFRYVQSAYMRLFTSLPTFACNQVLRAKLKDLWAVIPTMSLWYGVAGPMSLRFFPDSKSADGRKLPKQRATVVTVAIVYVWIWDWAWDTCFVAVCGS